MEWGLAHISSRELSEWMAFDAVEPIGERRNDYRLARLLVFLSTIVQVFVKLKNKRNAPKLSDFMLDFWAEKSDAKPAQTMREKLAMIEMWNAALGGQDLRK